MALAFSSKRSATYDIYAMRDDGTCLTQVAGGAGAGKSSRTLALLEAGCSYLGDDAVFLSVRGGSPAVLALPRPFHVAPRTAAAFPRISGLPTTTVERLSSAEAMGALIESSTFVIVDGLPGGSEHLDVLRRLGDGVEAWRVESGIDLLALPVETVQRVLQSRG